MRRRFQALRFRPVHLLAPPERLGAMRERAERAEAQMGQLAATVERVATAYAGRKRWWQFWK